MTCYYCGKPTSLGPYVDGDGIGWQANCDRPSCYDKAEADAQRQREARAQHRARGER